MNDIKFTLIRRRTQREGEVSANIEGAILPRVGDHVAHDQAKINGLVSDVMFWWDKEGVLREVQVAVK